jgi:hypothetical protein
MNPGLPLFSRGNVVRAEYALTILPVIVETRCRLDETAGMT